MSDLIWVGSEEECDLCHEQYPMSWIIFTGTQFLCYACYYLQPKEAKNE